MNKVPASSSTWLQNFRPHVNGVRASWLNVQLHLEAGTTYTLEMEYEHSYLIGDPESDIALCCQSGTNVTDLIVCPDFGELVPMKVGTTSLTWSISTTSQATGGPFTLYFKMPHYQGMPDSPPLPGRIFNLANELEVQFDDMSAAFGENANACHGAKHLLKVLPVGETLLDERVRLLRSVQAGVEISPAETTLRTLYQYGASWMIDCSKSTEDGEFEVRLEFVGLGFQSSPLSFGLGHHSVVAERWEAEYWDSKTYSIRATSRFLGTPAAGVQVKNNGVNYDKTDKYGEAHKTDEVGELVILTIKNLYDGSNA